MDMVGGDEKAIGNAKMLREGMLEPVQYVEKALDAVAGGA